LDDSYTQDLRSVKTSQHGVYVFAQDSWKINLAHHDYDCGGSWIPLWPMPCTTFKPSVGAKLNVYLAR